MTTGNDEIENIKEDILLLKSKILSDKEIENLRLLLEQDRRVKWLWSSIRTWVLAISSIIALATVGIDGIKTILKRLLT